MTTDETVIEHGCTVCGKPRPRLAVSSHNDFCSSHCAKTSYGTVTDSSGSSGICQQGDKKNAYASVENPYVPQTPLAMARWEASERRKAEIEQEKSAITRLAHALNARETVPA
jgi:endogenous inhibitor of DNA gyrase (YacG/DUF329 family)